MTSLKEQIGESYNLKTVLRDINLKIKPGQKVCLVGASGSGISIFMMAIVGEAILSKGSVFKNGRISYLSRNIPAFFPGTLKQNILMGHRFNPQKFTEIVDLVELDLSRFPAGE
jgi:ATPase subunit of ABC transporter with duplicated ATPase domains